jgi:hypothetical protein
MNTTRTRTRTRKSKGKRHPTSPSSLIRMADDLEETAKAEGATVIGPTDVLKIVAAVMRREGKRVRRILR